MLILRDLFVNSCIFITVLFIGSLLFKDTGIGSSAPVKTKIYSGILNGLLGVILMIFSIKVTPDAIIDLRHLPLIFGSVYLGSTSTLVTGFILVFFRIFNYGVSRTSIIVGVMISIATIGSIIIGKYKISNKLKWLILFFYNTFVFSISISLVAQNTKNLRTILLAYWIGSILSNIMVYFYVQYLLSFYSILKRLEAEATKDFLTGLNNTRSFDILFNSILSRVKGSNEKLSMLILDIDFFKKVNDNYGHSAGDEVLKELGDILAKSVRNFDIVARVGGEEFCIMLQECGLNDAYEIAERIRKSVEGHTFLLPSGIKINVTISIGIASFPESIEDIDKIKEAADNQLYRAKRTGRNRVCM